MTLKSGTPYLPFPHPVRLPTDESTTYPDRMLLFNSAWSPHVLTALKALARPETFLTEDPSERHFAMANGQDIVGAIQNLPIIPDWYLSFLTESEYAGLSRLQRSGFDLIDRYAFVVYQTLSPSLGGACNITFTAHFEVGGAQAGGKIDALVISLMTTGHAFAITGTDCNGDPISESGSITGYSILRSYPSIQDLTVTVDNVPMMWGTILSAGNALCGSV